jgi:hypothetical protein
MNEHAYDAEFAPVSERDLEQLRARVRWRSHGWVRDLRLSVRGSVLVLEGKAPSYFAKQLAQQALIEAKNVPVLANEIEVR